MRARSCGRRSPWSARGIGGGEGSRVRPYVRDATGWRTRRGAPGGPARLGGPARFGSAARHGPARFGSAARPGPVRRPGPAARHGASLGSPRELGYGLRVAHGEAAGADARSWRLERSWWDVAGVAHEVPQETADAVLAELADGAAGAPSDPVWVVRAGAPVETGGEWSLTLEDGGVLEGRGSLPGSIPLGYHVLHRAGQAEATQLVVTPRSCHLADDLRVFGLGVQCYALRSRTSWGIGDLGDLRRLAEWASELGAGIALLNPLHATAPSSPQEPSPYFPTSRIWRNPLYLRIEAAPGAELLGAELTAGAAAGRALLATRRLDRDRVWALKSAALEGIFAVAPPGADFARWRSDAGAELEHFARFCALAELHGPTWTRWPGPLREVSSPETAAAAAQLTDRVRYHAWLQWLLELQLIQAETEIPLVADLAVGVDPGGADTWVFGDAFAKGVRLGAPPDDFNVAGQDWGVAAFHPERLRQRRFAPYVAALRANLRWGGGIRVDHVMGLWRLWWIPEGASAAAGCYVRYPHEELLDILALESVRAGAFVVGEDLGTVPPGVREELARRSILRSAVGVFEDDPPGAWPSLAVGSISTHDLPTLEGLRSGADGLARRRAGLAVDDAADARSRARLESWLPDAGLDATESPAGAGEPGATGLPQEGSPQEGSRRQVSPQEGSPREGSPQEGSPTEGSTALPAVDTQAVALHRVLGASPCRVVVASLEDLLGVVERPNMPGTTDAWPNWSLALPRLLEDLVDDPRAVAVLEALRAGRALSGG